MKLTDADVRKMSNLAEWKLKALIKSFNGKIKLQEINDKATLLMQEAVIDKDHLQTQKYEDLLECLAIIKKQFQEEDGLWKQKSIH